VVAGSNPVSPTQVRGCFARELGTTLGPVPKRSTQTRFQRPRANKLGLVRTSGRPRHEKRDDSLSARTLSTVVDDVVDSLAGQGVRSLIIVNAHGGNYVLSNVVQEASAQGQARVGLYPSREDWAEARQAAGITSTAHDDMHAGELETSILLATHPGHVRDDGRRLITSRPIVDTSRE
jgi:hypothetical protein